MIKLGDLGSCLAKTWEKPFAEYMLSPRLCRKHFLSMLKKEKIKDDTCVALLGTCSKCYKAGVVFYLHDKKT